MSCILFALTQSVYAGNPDAYDRKLAQFERVYANLTEERPPDEEQIEET
jgi:hypothetical protein